MATIPQHAHNIGEQLREKRKAAQAMEGAAQKAAEDKLKAQQQHEENKKQGML